MPAKHAADKALFKQGHLTTPTLRRHKAVGRDKEHTECNARGAKSWLKTQRVELKAPRQSKSGETEASFKAKSRVEGAPTKQMRRDRGAFKTESVAVPVKKRAEVRNETEAGCSAKTEHEKRQKRASAFAHQILTFSREAIASSTSASTLSFASAASTSESLGRMSGCLGKNTVQQSSKG